MDFIDVRKDNLEEEHICCVMADKKGDHCIQCKKDWMRDRLDEGLVFKKLNVRGKVFIEYIPAEYAWYPIEAKGFMMIDCLWVAGKYKGQGIADLLLDECIKDCKEKGMKGLVALSSKKKMPFLNDGDFLKHRGFKVCDTAYPTYELLYLPFKECDDIPKINECAKDGTIGDKCMKVYYTNQCPYSEKYVKLIQKIADDRGIELKVKKFETRQETQNAPAPFTTYSFFYDGKFFSQNIFSENSFIKFLEKNKIS